MSYASRHELMKSYLDILEKANEIVNLRSEEKEREYGPFDESIKKAAQMATIFCNKEII